MMKISSTLPRFSPASTSARPAQQISADQQTQSLNNLSKLLSNSPHEKGYLRFSLENGWKFSPNMSVRDKLHLRDAGYSKAPINPADMKLAKPGEKIERSNLESRLENQMNLTSTMLNALDSAATTSPAAKPRKSTLPADLVKPTITPRTLLPGTHTPDTPIAAPTPTPRSDLAKLRDISDTGAGASNELGTASVKSRAQAWEALAHAAQ